MSADCKIKIDGDGVRQLHRAHARRSEEDAGSGDRRGQPMLRQPSRAVDPTRPRRGMGLWRHGMRRWKGPRLKDVLDKVGIKKECIEIAVDGADGRCSTRPRISSRACRSGGRWTRVHHHRLRDERPAAPAFQRLPGAAGGARLDRHLLDEAPHPYRCTDNAVGRVLDEARLSSSGGQVSRSAIASSPRKMQYHADHRDGRQLADHQPSRRRNGEGRHGHGVGGRLGWRLWHPPVEVSTDGGKTWSTAKLGEDLGKYAFRPWSFELRKSGKNTVMVNATNMIGQTQTSQLLFNGAGYHNNVMQSITLTPEGDETCEPS